MPARRGSAPPSAAVCTAASKPETNFARFFSFERLTGPPLESMVVDVVPASVDANSPVTIQTNRIGRMLKHSLMRPHHKRSSKEIGHLDRNYVIGLRFRCRKPDPAGHSSGRVRSFCPTKSQSCEQLDKQYPNASTHQRAQRARVH
eukprot:3800076-Amphidinium_carterae.1